MPQLRRDRLTQEWVFVATESVKPEELIVKRPRKLQSTLDLNCPLCLNTEDQKAPELLRMPCVGGVGWPVRIVALRNPAPPIEAPPIRSSRLLRSDAESSNLQEFVVETPDHSLHTALLPDLQLANVLRVIKTRYDELSCDPRVAHVNVAKKHGSQAGAAFEHSHWQLTGTETLPAQVSGWLQHARRHYGHSGTCVFCVTLQEELEAETRIVTAGDHFVALEPYASPSPFYTHIYPRRHMASFSEINGGEIQDLARILHRVLARFYLGLEDPDFHCTLRTAPLANAGIKYYHWSFNIVPCLSPITAPGKEACVNSVLPESAAEFLRAVRVEQAIPA
jgi:UDPglucose--hexose-1-phosphate uridylyltransferase